MDTAESKLHRTDLLVKWLACKLLSHAWQIGGTINLLNRYKIDLTGMNLYNFKYLLKIGLLEFSRKNGSLLPTEEALHLCTLLAGSHFLDQEDAALLQADFQKGSPISILTGFKGHRVVVSFDGDYLILANKGGETRKPLELFKIDRQKIDAAAIQKLIDLTSQESKDYTKWLGAIHKNYGASKDSLCLCIEQAYPLSSYQQVGNCEWESLQTNVYGVVLLHRLKDRFESAEKANLIALTNQTFQEWQQFIQLQSLGSFFNVFNIQENAIPFNTLDPSFLRSLFIQYWSTPSPSSEFKTKMDEMESQYFQSLDAITCSMRKTEKIYHTRMSQVPYLAKDLTHVWMPTVLSTAGRMACDKIASYAFPSDFENGSYFHLRSIDMYVLLPFYSYSIYYTTQLLRRYFAI